MKISKAIFLLIFLFSYLFVPGVNKILNHEINYLYISSIVANSFYEDIKTVSTDEKLVVKDYLIEENRLYIFPMTNDVKLPIGVMISNKTLNSVEVVSLDDRFYIYNLDEINSYIYQYIDSFNSIGKTNDYVVIVGDDLSRIINNLEIYYEKV